MSKEQMQHASVLTVSAGHGLRPGHRISLTAQDRRWWRRLWFWLLRRGTPQRAVVRTVAEVNGNTVHLR